VLHVAVDARLRKKIEEFRKETSKGYPLGWGPYPLSSAVRVLLYRALNLFDEETKELGKHR
jgi:hypothetical protein